MKISNQDKKMVNFRLSEAHRDLLSEFAESQGVSMTAVIRYWIEKFIQRSNP